MKQMNLTDIYRTFYPKTKGYTFFLAPHGTFSKIDHITGHKQASTHCWWDCKLVQPLWKSFWQFLRKLDIVLPEDPAISLLGIYPEDVPTGNKATCSTMFIADLFIIARIWKEPRCPSTEEWVQKL